MGSSAREPAASSSVRCREGPPFSRPRGTNPESAKIASRPFPSPLLRSLSFFPSSSSSPFFLNLFPLPSLHTAYPHSPPPPPAVRASRSWGGGRGGGGGWGEGRWRRGSSDQQTHQPQVRLCPLRSARSCAGGRAGQTRGARLESGPRPGTGERRALALPAEVLSRRGCGVDSFPYLFIYLFSRSRSPLLSALLSTPFSRPHSLLPCTPAFTPPPPEPSGREEGASQVSGLEGRVVLWVSCAKVRRRSARRRRRQRTGSDRFGLFFYL